MGIASRLPGRIAFKKTFFPENPVARRHEEQDEHQHHPHIAEAGIESGRGAVYGHIPDLKSFRSLGGEHRPCQGDGVIARQIRETAGAAVGGAYDGAPVFNGPHPSQFKVLEAFDGVSKPAVLGLVHHKIRIFRVLKKGSHVFRKKDLITDKGQKMGVPAKVAPG